MAKKTVSKSLKKAPKKAVAKTARKADSKSPGKPSGKTVRKPPKAAAARSSAGLVEGMAAPSFSLTRDGGQSVALADFAGRKLVLFFYPRADTPGCTREAMDFTRLQKDFDAAGTAVLGISADSPKKQESFRNKHQLGVALLSDEQQTTLIRYGVWAEKSMYGKLFMGIVRTTVLIGRDGEIARIWRNVRVDGHADEVLETAKSL